MTDGRLAGKVVVITGAGGGIGRAHAKLFAELGASVVVNDLGGDTSRAGNGGRAQEAVDQIVDAGGSAVASTHDVSDWNQARALIATAESTFGRLDVLVNNAGVLRDAFIAKTEEDEWDDVLRINLKGHAAPLVHAVRYWKKARAGGLGITPAVVNTASASGTIMPNPGQANYGAAKAGVAALTLVASQELTRLDGRANAIAPVASTRLTQKTPGFEHLFAADAQHAEMLSPSNISPLVAYLCLPECTFNGEVFTVQGGHIGRLAGWSAADEATSDHPWTLDSVTDAVSAWSLPTLQQ